MQSRFTREEISKINSPIHVVSSCRSFYHSSDKVIPAVSETLVELAPSVRDEDIFGLGTQLTDESLDLVARDRMYDIGSSFAVVNIESFPLVDPTCTVTRVAFFENGSDLWACLCQFLVRYCARVVDDLIYSLVHCLRINAVIWTYKLLAKDTRRCLDVLAHHFEILFNLVGVLVWRFV
jgi:hypothetical protein